MIRMRIHTFPGKHHADYNGIIENYDVIKENLISRGHKFTSDTDTEVLVHFIEEIHKQEKEIFSMPSELYWTKYTGLMLS